MNRRRILATGCWYFGRDTCRWTVILPCLIFVVIRMSTFVTWTTATSAITTNTHANTHTSIFGYRHDSTTTTTTGPFLVRLRGGDQQTQQEPTAGETKEQYENTTELLLPRNRNNNDIMQNRSDSETLSHTEDVKSYTGTQSYSSTLHPPPSLPTTTFANTNISSSSSSVLQDLSLTTIQQQDSQTLSMIQIQSQQEQQDLWQQDEESLQQQQQLNQKYKALYHLKITTGYIQTSYNGSYIQQPSCDVYILGTAHVSNQSCTEAQSLMQDIQPDFLFLELCNQRLALLIPENIEKEGMNVEDGKEMQQEVKETSTGSSSSTTTNQDTSISSHNLNMSRIAAMSSNLLTKVQGDYATKLGVVIGGEFRIAFQMAMKQQALYEQQFYSIQQQQQQQQIPSSLGKIRNGCTVILGDRPMKLTLTRAWESLSFFSKIRLILGLLWSCIRQPSEEELRIWIQSILNDPNSDLLTKSMEELGRVFPTLQQTIVHERDIFMAVKLLQLANIMGEATAMDGKPRVVLAIVGVGHCKGMVSFLSNYTTLPMKQTMTSLESVLQPLVETKRLRAETNQDIRSLLSDIIVVENSNY